jgi:hypothetical protein
MALDYTMKTKIILFILALVCVVTLSASPQSKPQTWEYKVMVGKCWDEKKINILGADGWELTTYTTWGTSAGPVETCVFKRPKT